MTLTRTPRRLVRSMPAFLVFAAGCASSGAAPHDDGAAAAVHEPKKKAGPSLTVEDQQELAGSTLLIETERQKQDLVKTQDRLNAVEETLKTKDAELQRVVNELSASLRERDEFKKLLDEALGKERGLREQATAAEIERLRMERKLLELRLGELVKEKP